MARPTNTHEFDQRATKVMIGAWLGYALVFVLSYPTLGVIASALVLVPVFFSAWYGGMAYALLAGMLSFPYNAYLFYFAGVPSMPPSDHLVGNIMALIFSVLVGYIGETRQRLAAEVAERRTAETQLEILNAQLDEQVKTRAAALHQTNLRLRHESDSRKAAEFEVSYREDILSAVADIGESILKGDSWAVALPSDLEALGIAARVNRVYVFQNSVGSRGQVLTSQIAEWSSAETETHRDDPALQNFDYQARGFGRWVEVLSQGKPIHDDVSALPEGERQFLSSQGIDSILIVPIMTGFDWWGNIGFDSVGRSRTWNAAEIEALTAAASIIGAAILREEDYERTLLGWAKALELRDEETEGHTQRVTQMTVKLAGLLGCSEQELINIRRGALLHDIGKMGIPDDILRKPGPLSEAEWQIMRRHPIYARDMLAPLLFLAPAISIPFSHHERWDGSGYPLGLRGKDIPFAARIFAVVDVWDALTSDRPYRAAWSTEKAESYLHENSGALFDPEIIPLFFELLEQQKVKRA